MPNRVPISPDVRRLVLESADYSCIYCLGEANAVDHIIPISQNGDDDPSNLVAACKQCNSIAGARVFDSLSEKIAYVRNVRLDKGYHIPVGSRPSPKPPKLLDRLAERSRWNELWEPIFEDFNMSNPKFRLTAMKNAHPNVTYQDLADYYGVSKGLIWKIINEDHLPKDPALRERLDYPELIITYQHRDKQGRFVKDPIQEEA